MGVSRENFKRRMAAKRAIQAHDTQRNASIRDRAALAEVLLFNDSIEVEKQDTLTDLLTDLMHFAMARGWSFDDSLRMARDHFATEAKPPLVVAVEDALQELLAQGYVKTTGQSMSGETLYTLTAKGKAKAAADAIRASEAAEQEAQ